MTKDEKEAFEDFRQLPIVEKQCILEVWKKAKRLHKNNFSFELNESFRPKEVF